jgi:transposase-like protein
MPEPTKRRGRQLDANSKSGKIRELLKTGASASDIAKKLGCTPALVYNVKARMSGGGGGGGAKRGPGRPRKSASGSSMDGLSGILEMVKNSDRERSAMRSALERIQALVNDALG